MKVKNFHKNVGFEPENTYEAFQLGRLFEKTRQELEPGVSTGSDKTITNELLGIRFDVAKLVEYLLSHP